MGRQMRRKALVLMLVLWSVPVAAQSVPIGWALTPDWNQVDNCPGNCGAGCQGSPNVCGGSQTWYGNLTNASHVEELDGGWWEGICPFGTVLYNVRIVFSRTPATYTYEGHSTDGCRAHDEECRASNSGWWCWFTGPLALSCGNEQYPVWSYNGWAHGYIIRDWYATSQQCYSPAENELEQKGRQ